MSGRTPGPWSVQVASKALVIFGDSTMPRTVVARVPNIGYPDAAVHDARLIAAAPDLLNALMTLTDVAEDRGIPCDAAIAAIARATGEKA